MRVLYLNPCGQLGGAENSLLEVLTSVNAAEPNWELWLVLGEDGPLVREAQKLGVQVMVAPFPDALAQLGDSGNRAPAIAWSGLKATGGTAFYAWRLARIVKAIQPDVIHTNGFKMHILALWARSHQTPVIWHIRDYVSSRSLMKRLLRIHASRCKAAIGNSESVTRDIRSVCGPRLDTCCVYNAVDLARYSPAGEKCDLDRLAGLPPAPTGTARVGLIATLARWKGHQVFLRALAQLPHDLSYRAYVIGGPIYQTENSQRTLDELRSLAAELGVADKVGFTGFVRESANAMRALDVVVHASTEAEPFGRVIAEGMACGRPVICSAAGGAAELIQDGYDALAHPPGDAAVLADRIAQLVRCPDLRARLGRAGRATAERRFELSRLAAELIPLYERAVGHVSSDTAVQLAPLR